MPRALLLLLLAALPGLALPSAAVAGPFEDFELQVSGKIVYVADEDIDGDGRVDLVVNHLEGLPPDVKRRISVFKQKPDGSFRPKPDQRISVPSRVGLTDLCRIGEETTHRLLFLDGSGVRTLSLDPATGLFAKGRPERYVRTDTLVAWPEEEDIPYWNFCRDWDGRPGSELLVPDASFARLFSATAEPALLGKIRLRMASYLESADAGYYGGSRGPRSYELRYMTHLPLLETGEYDGDGHTDLYSLWEDRVTVHRGLPAGGFEESASVRVRLDPRSKDEKVARNAGVHGILGDANGDGLSDLLMVKVSGGLRNMRSVLRLHLNRKGEGYDRKADRSYDRKGFSGLPTLHQVDSDGKLDLVLPSVDIGIVTMGRILVAGQMDVDFLVLPGGEGGFATKPAVTHEVVFPMDYSRGAELQGPYPIYGVDFTGDGKSDLCAASDDDELAFFPGGAKGVPSEDARRTLKLKLSRYLRVLRTRADGPPGLLIYYKDKADLEGRIRVYVNKGADAWR